MQAISIAEARKARPPYFAEVYAVALEISWYPMLPSFTVRSALNDLWRNDEILCDRDLDRFSVNPAMQQTAENETGFELMSDRHVRKYPQYLLNERILPRPGPDTPVINFK